MQTLKFIPVPQGFAAAKAHADVLMAEVKRTGDALEVFPKNGPMGLTPDHVRATPEFRAAKQAFDIAFANLRAFNAHFTKFYAAELRAERRARRERY